jgi:hypothetical protein
MPNVFDEGKRFVQRWKPEWDLTLLVVSHKYRSLKGFVRWKEARADGYFNDFPEYLSNKDLSHRLYHLLYQKFDKNWKRKKQQYCSVKRTISSYERRKSVFDSLPDDVKKKYGYKKKRVWSQKQIDLLFKLVDEYRKTPKTIDWRKLIKDKRVEKLPHQEVSRIRSYYWETVVRQRPDVLEQRRAYSLKWNQDNRERYRENQKKRIKMYRKAVNDHLNKKL